MPAARGKKESHRAPLVRGGGSRRRSIGLSALGGLCALYFALVFFAVVTADIEPLAVHSVVHGLPRCEFPCLESTAVVNLVDQIGALQFVDLLVARNGFAFGTAPDVRALVPTRDRPLLIGGRRLVAGRCNCCHYRPLQLLPLTERKVLCGVPSTDS